MNTFVPPPPPAGVVVPPPPPVIIPVPPAAVPASPSAAASTEANVVKPGGVALDMSSHFGPQKNVPKKSLPPWERKKLSAALSGSSPRADNSTPPPGPVDATSGPLPPAAVPLPQTAVNAPAVVTRESLSTASLTASPQPCAPPSYTSAMSGAAVAHTGVASPPVVSVPPPPPPVHLVVQTVPSSAATTAAPPLPRPTPDAQAPLPAPASATTGASTLPLPSPSVNQSATVAAAAIPQGAAQPTLSTSSPAAIAATDHIVQETMWELRPYLLSPMLTVLAPHVVFQGDEHQWVVPPLGPVPPSKRKKAPSAAVVSAGGWYNRYGLQPSPSFDAAQHDGSEPLVTYAATSGTRRQWTSNTVINSAKAKSNWRETYWKHVDVRRYVARRYFGAPPPLEQ
ncbi:conserved hypothetical protein [Leishmania mexicana MHOM/GT/2001/U1103]|uniref:Uncharacterized protein n=1 Tax=Leishmania mexicana (strain MHOM/GT/2001/U1103) TaxID=929439 RepID=E9B3V9_LEIMU|nr:conserved hypothetical protein [Leishmania mexicana MHOM/GT/2001/U1103]CBZ29926.1 conserved hypothetical protein [Leishmania mexicana MHOM/GT/2001/U1103]